MPTGRNIPAATAAVTAQAAAASASLASLPSGTLLARRAFTQNTAAANGAATISLPVPAGGQDYLVDIIHVSTNATTATAVSVQVDGNEVDFTPNGNQDVAFETPAIWVPSGSQLSVAWSGAIGNVNCGANLQYRVVAS